MNDPVKSFCVGYNPVNESNVFSSGDQITGQVILELEKDTKVGSLLVKLKGKAKVSWVENYGRTIIHYCSKEKYFSIKQFLIQEGQGNHNISQGCSVYPFTFQIPAGDLPSSFKGEHGKIVYLLEAILSRSMRTDSKAKAELTLIPRNSTISDVSLLAPQQGITDKKMKLFASGTVGLDVNIDRTGYYQGEGIKVVASIQNKSSRDVKPKYCLYRKYSYFADGHRKVQTKELLKEVGEVIPPSGGQTVSRIITIPPTDCPTILNCSIIRTEFRLRVYLDVKYASDPEIKFPIVILPTSQGPDKDQAPVYSTYGSAFADTGTNNPQNPTAFSTAPPPPYTTYGMYPSLTDFGGKS